MSTAPAAAPPRPRRARQAALVAVSSLAAALAAWGLTSIAPGDEAATALVQFRPLELRSLGSLEFGVPEDVELSPEFASDAARRAGTTPEALDEAISLSADRETAVVKITAEESDADRARAAADGVAVELTDRFRGRLVSQARRYGAFVRFLAARPELWEGDLTARALRRDRERIGRYLDLLRAERTPELVQPAEARARPLAPRALRGAVAAGLLGLLLSLGLLALTERRGSASDPET